VFLTSSSDAKLERGKALGAEILINYARTPDWEQEILKHNSGEGLDHVIDSAAPPR
jgi:NADPH:quinone reductase-like Zn-dependent oxidoreductase